MQKVYIDFNRLFVEIWMLMALPVKTQEEVISIAEKPYIV